MTAQHRIRPTESDLWMPFVEEMRRALGWVILQALWFVQPLLRGWGGAGDGALERMVRWLEGEGPAGKTRQP